MIIVKCSTTRGLFFHPTRGLVIFEESKVVMFKSKKECDLFISNCEWIDGEISQRLSPMELRQFKWKVIMLNEVKEEPNEIGKETWRY